MAHHEEIRTFETGATRNGNERKLSYLRHLSPKVMRRFVQYMDKHRVMPDGTVREPDNWKLGIPKREYAESLFRHFMEFWAITEEGEPGDVQEALCAVIFNAMGYLYEDLGEDAGPYVVGGGNE